LGEEDGGEAAEDQGGALLRRTCEGEAGSPFVCMGLTDLVEITAKGQGGNGRWCQGQEEEVGKR